MQNKWCEKYPKGSLICHKGFGGWHDFETLCTRPCTNGIYPENTYEAVLHAIRLGYKMIEIDINVSKDGVWLCHHEPNTMFLEYDARNFTDMTFEEIHSMPFLRSWKGGGCWLFSEHIAKEYVPTLDSVLELCKKHDIFVILDTKWIKHHTYTEKEMDDLAALIVKHDMVENCAAYGASFSPLPGRLPEITVAYTDIPAGSEEQAAEKMLSHKNVMLDVSFKKYPECVDFCKKYNIPLVVWFTDDYRDMEKAFNDGVDYLMTNSCLVNPNLSDYKTIYSYSQKDFENNELVLDYEKLDLHPGDMLSLKFTASSGEVKIMTKTEHRYSIREIKNQGSHELYYTVNDAYPHDLIVSLNPSVQNAELLVLRETARGEK